MQHTAEKPVRFILPDRIRGKVASKGDFAARIALIDRIAELDGIEAIESNDEAVPRNVDVYLRTDNTDRILRRRPAQLFISINSKGISLHGLSRWEQHQVLAHGWGSRVDDLVCLQMPRTEGELEVIWSIVHRAYKRLYVPVRLRNASPVMSTWGYPQFSRSTHR